MALLYVTRDPADTGDGALNTAKIAGSWASTSEGLLLEPGTWNLRALTGAAIKVPANRTLSFPGAILNLVSTDGTARM